MLYVEDFVQGQIAQQEEAIAQARCDFQVIEELYEARFGKDTTPQSGCASSLKARARQAINSLRAKLVEQPEAAPNGGDEG